MSTRATIHFLGYDGKAEAIIYRHCDGYPDGLRKDLKRFFEDVTKQTNDTRFTDASYLAAKWVVWDARRSHESHVNFGGAKPENYLDFLSVGVVHADPGDIEYRYLVNCHKQDKNGYPKVTTQRA